MPGAALATTVSVPPTVKLAVPPLPMARVAAEGAVVNGIEPPPKVILPPVVAMENERVASPATVKLSAALIEPVTKPTSPVTDPAPAEVTTMVPPVPRVKVPNLSDALETCASVIGATTLALDPPVVV